MISAFPAEHRLEIDARVEELRHLGDWLRRSLPPSLPKDAAFALDLGLYEAVANAVTYAFPDKRRHTIAVTVRQLEDRVEIEVVDDGIPFDPLTFALPPLPTRLEDVVPGGNGIRLMRRFLDDLQYRRADERNHLLLTRRLGAPGPA